MLIREGEGKSTMFFVLLFLSMGAGIAIGRGSADALFLKRYGIENLAYVYLGLAVLLALVSTVYAAFVDRISAERFLFLLFGIQLVALVVSWLFMDVLNNSSIYPGYYALYTISSELLIVHGGVYIGQNLNTLQAKRLTPLIFGGYQLGMMLGGLLLVSFVAKLGLNSAPLVWGVSILLSSALLAWRHARHGASPFFFPPSRRNRDRIRHALDEVRQGFDFTRRKPLLKSASYALVFMVITYYMLSYSAKVIYNQTFKSEEELLSFFGGLVIMTNIGAMVLQFFVTNRAMSWIGVRKTKYIYPVSVIISFTLLLVYPRFIAALIASISRDTIMPAFRTPVRQMFFNVLPEYMKGRARATMIAVVMPFALFVCGLLIIIMQHLGNLAIIAIAGLMLSLVYLYFCVRMGKNYVSTLIESMKEKLYLPEQVATSYKGDDSEMFNALVRGLNSANDMVSLSYAKALMSSYPEEAIDLILDRIESSSMDVTDQLIQLIRNSINHDSAQKLLRYIDRGDLHLQATIYDVINESGYDMPDQLVVDLLNSPGERIRASGIRAAFNQKSAANKVMAVSTWCDLLEGDQHCQLAALGLLSILGLYDVPDIDRMINLYQKSMVTSLSEADEKIRCHFYNAMLHWHWLLPEQVRSEILSDARHISPRLRSAAVKCLYALPESETRIQAIWDALDDGHPDVRNAAMISLNKVCSDHNAVYSEWLVGNKTGTPRAQKMLLEWLIQSGVGRNFLESIVVVKSAYATDLLCAVNAMKAHVAVDACYRVTTKALAERLQQVVDLALLALQTTMDANTIAVIRAAISSRDSRFTEGAQEALQCLKNKNLVHLLDGLVAGSYAQTVKSSTGKLFMGADDVYRWCMSLDDPWLRTCGMRGHQVLKEQTS